MAEKYVDPEFDDESKESFWLYVDKLQSFSTLDSAIPSALRENVFDIAKEVQSTGDISVAFNRAKEMAEKMTEEDSQEIMDSLQKLMKQIPPEVIQNVMSNPQVAQMLQSKTDNNFAPAEMMSKFQDMMKKQ